MRLFWLLLAVTVAMAAVGMQHLVAEKVDNINCARRSQIWGVGDYVYRFLLILNIGGEGIDPRRCFNHWSMEVTRFTGPGAVAAGLLVLAWDFLASPRRWWRRVGLRGHTVIAGLGERGLSLAKASRRAVAIDPAPPPEVPGNVVVVAGDATDEEALDKARIGRAAAVFAATGDPLVNLRIARLAAARGVKDVYALASDPLIRRGLVAQPDSALNLIAVEELAARELYAAARFHELADLMGHRDIRLALLGEGTIVEAIAAQVLRAGLTRPDARPSFLLVSQDAARARAGLLRSYPGIEAAAELEFAGIDLTHDPLTEASPLLARLGQGAPPTALVVAQLDPARNYPLAAALRAAQHRGDGPAAPIFFGVADLEAVRDLARPLAATPRLGEVLQPFRLGAGVCTSQAILAIDDLAQDLHRGYLETHEALTKAGNRPSAARESLVSWEALPATYRQANRRSAAHAAAKLFAAGCYVPPDPFAVPQNLDVLGGATLEALSELEHKAWMVDRQLEGWRYGARRDDLARFHPHLTDYAQLADETKELDRAEVRQLVASLGHVRLDQEPRAPVRFELWIGLAGALELSAEDAVWLESQVREAVAEAAERGAGRMLTFLTCLAPGADAVMTRAALQAAAQLGAPHRLLVVEALRPLAMIDDFEPRWRPGAVLGFDKAECETSWPDAARALAEEREAAIAAAPGARVAQLLAAPGETPYQTQNRYLVSRSDVLIAAVRGGPRRPGGTGEAVAWRSGKIAMGPGFGGVTRPAVPELPHTLELDLVRRSSERR